MNIPFTQTKEYLSWHQAVGTKTFYKEFFHAEGNEVGAIVASLIINLRVGKVLYVPYGPVYFRESPKIKQEILNYLFELAKKENCVFVRLENLFPPEKQNLVKNFLKDGSHAVPAKFFPKFCFSKLVCPPKKVFAKEAIFQPRVEWWLDLDKSENELYENLHKDHRYSIRRSQKENIQTEIVKEEMEKYFDIFWSLLKETSTRDHFQLYDKDYYQAVFKNTENKFLVLTKQGDEFLSVALILVHEKIANLVFAGSISEKRELGFNHLMQWEAIRKAKTLGARVYNFGGIFENGYGKPGLAGVTNFKKKFGGYAKFHGEFLDIPVKKIKYLLYLIYKMVK